MRQARQNRETISDMCSPFQPRKLRFFGRKNLQIVRIAHQAENIPERVNHGRSDEPGLAVYEGFVFLRTLGKHFLEHHLRNVVDMPEYNCTSRTRSWAFWRVFRVDDAHIMLVVTKTKPPILRFVRIWAFEVGLNTQ